MDQRPSCLVKIDTQNFNNQLTLPAGVISFFNGVPIPNEIALRMTSCAKGWFVDLVRIENTYVLCNAGWSEFVRDFDLKFEDRILFEYNRNSQILVTVYDDESGNPKDLVSRNYPTVQTDVNIEQGDEHEPRMISSDVDSDHEADEHSSSDKMSTSGDAGESSTMGGKALVKEVIRAFGSVSKHPFFVVSLSKSCIRTGDMCIPSAFGNKYLPTGRKEFKLIIASNEKSWKVVTCSRRTGSKVIWRFVKGWAGCVQGSGLREGDICAFELIDRDAAKMKVSVYRVSGDTLVRTDVGN